MNIDVQKLLKDCGHEQPFYPGKRMVQKLAQAGEYKSHCVVYDWRAPDTVRVDIKAGLTGKDLPAKDLAKYPISFQSPTYIEIDMTARDEEEEGEDETGRAKGGGSGGAKMKKRQPERRAFSAFSAVVEGKVNSMGAIARMVVMGKDIAASAFETVLGALTAQIRQMKVTPVNVVAAITKVTKVAPGGKALNEIDRSLLEGVQPYNPKDMFGGEPNPA